MIKPILSICIPTYNRANWLRSSLWNWLPQVKETNGLVELIVCDNASPDHTKQVIEEASAWGDFQYYCNDENIGIFGNIYRLVKDLAQGQFVWVVGDDDLPSVDAIERVLDVLKNSADVNYIYVNYSYWTPSKEKQNELLESKDLNFSQTYSSDLETRYVNKISELISIDHSCFTPICCSIMRKQDACEAYQSGIRDECFSSIEATIPHAVYIAKKMLNQSAYYIGIPSIIASHDVSWSKHLTHFVVYILPSLYNIIQKNGGKKSVIDLHKQKIMGFLFYKINEYRLSQVSIADKLYMSYRCYVHYDFLAVLINDLKFVFYVFRKYGGKIKKLGKKLLVS